jgi:hypothetical protein
VLRHTMLALAGEDLDTESGLPHLAHAIVQALFLLEYYLQELGEDDRWRTMEAKPVPSPTIVSAASTTGFYPCCCGAAVPMDRYTRLGCTNPACSHYGYHEGEGTWIRVGAMEPYWRPRGTGDV